MADIKWETKKVKFGPNPNVCYLGKWHVGSVVWTKNTKGDPVTYAASTVLPGLKNSLGHFATEVEAMKKVEAAITYWLASAGVA